MAGLEGRYDFRVAEPTLVERWAATGIYELDPAAAGRPYTVDTPPPTVSGQIHLGHVYSYTHADIVIRYHRMKGEQVFYPFGFDDNGLPTERFTENVKGIRAREAGREAFIKACLELSAEVEAKFERFWKRLGLSVDWRLRYSTIDPRSRRVAQAGFRELYEKGQVYRQVAPTLWCPECGTALAQADVEDKTGVAAAFTTIPFALEGGGELLIATTRPELLPACVAVFVHPEDERYQALVGTLARAPLYDMAVPILADERAEREKGTGAVMCCTFGDVTDVAWWRDHHLPLRIVIGENGRLTAAAGPYAGLTIRQARRKILEDLEQAGQIRGQRPIEHDVGVHERCGTEIEYLVAGQWFVKILENKERFVEAGRRIRWHPDYMRTRYEGWVEGLSWDWNISRQRYYGVPFPVWYCRGCDEVVLARPDQLPVDPLATPPPVDHCPRCGSGDLAPEADVMDTWATSSLTPQICATLLEFLGISPEEFDRRYRPMTMRPNAHDIIRTWDFYTVVRSLYHDGEIPWTELLISGHALDPAGKKLSKSRLKAAEDPTAMLERFSADAVRYWTAGARLGADTVLSETIIRNGQRLVTKLWNAAKLAWPYVADYRPPAAPPTGLKATDAWLLDRLRGVIERASGAMEEYEYTAAKAEVERFFWSDLCDNYLELIKYRLYGEPGRGAAGAEEHEGARYTLYQALLAVLKLLAPVMPFITDELYGACFQGREGGGSIHVSPWPSGDDDWASPEAATRGEAILAVVEAVRRWKAERKLSVAAPLEAVRIVCPEELAESLRGAAVDLRSVTRAREIAVRPASVTEIETEVVA